MRRLWFAALAGALALGRGGAAQLSSAQALSAPAANPAPSLDALIAAYGRGDYAAAEAAFRRVVDQPTLLHDFKTHGILWPAPRSEATLALELVNATLFSKQDDVRRAASDLLAQYGGLVRQPVAADGFERDWWRTALAIVEGTIRPAAAQRFVDAALKRIPDDPRVLLASAIVADQMHPFGSLEGSELRPIVSDLLARYDAAAGETAVEGAVRGAWVLHRAGRQAEALERLDKADDTSPDIRIAYLRRLFRGHVLSALGRGDDAAAAYRAALVLWPAAQSARIGLMNALVQSGALAEARTLAEAIETAPPDELDPWWFYWQGDYRFYPASLARLREQAR